MMTLTTKDLNGFIKGSQKIILEEKMKLLQTSTMSFAVKGKPVIPGEFFEIEKDVYVSQMIGNGSAVEVTKDNEKDLQKKSEELKKAYEASLVKAAPKVNK